MVVQLRIRFGQPPPRILFVGRQRLYAVIRAVNGFQVAAGMVRQFKPDPVGVTDTRDSVLAVALKRDAVVRVPCGTASRVMTRLMPLLSVDTRTCID
ncbi:hypothetical protein GF011_07680 [Escherichia coli]|nr:hypothetical protein [Escherichia coli]